MSWSIPDAPAENLKKSNVADKTVLITGGNTGFGYIAAGIMLKAGASVIIACRSKARAEEAIAKLKELTKSGKITYLILDVSNPNSIKACADKIIKEKIHFDVLVNNAGISLVPEYREAITGFESTLQTNYLGSVQFTELVLEHLVKESSEPRVVFVNSNTYPKGRPAKTTREEVVIRKENYHNFGSYYRSKYLLTSYGLAMARKHPECHFVVCDPGTGATSIAREFGCLGWVQQTRFCRWIHPAEGGGIAIAFCALDKSCARTGIIVYDLKDQEPIPAIKSIEEQDQLFDLTHELLEEGIKRAASQQ